jgi:hypothetical protein
MPSEPDHRLPHSPAFAEDTLIAHLYALFGHSAEVSKVTRESSRG